MTAVPVDDTTLYKIYDTEEKRYVVRELSGYYGSSSGKKFAWKTPGAAKSSAMIYITNLEWKAFQKLNPSLLGFGRDYVSYSNPLRVLFEKERTKRFKDQGRFEIHEFELTFVKKV